MRSRPQTPPTTARWEIAVAAVVLLAMVALFVKFQGVDPPAVPEPTPARAQEASAPTSPPAEIE